MDKKHPVLCDPGSGICELPATSSAIPVMSSVSKTKQSVTKPLKLLYFTDPICSSCWGIEAPLRKLKLAFGHCLEIEYRMGGLLPDWRYNSGGISKPSDVAGHWDEVSNYYDMPIDGDVWLEDPLPSSFPPSIAFKAAQLQDPFKAVQWLREIREMVFLRKKNITRWEHLSMAAVIVGLDAVQLKEDFAGKANELFQDDLNLARAMGVRGFPTIFFSNPAGEVVKVNGAKPYAVFEQAVLKVYPAAKPNRYDQQEVALFTHFSSLTAREFSELTDTPRFEAESRLNELVAQGHLEKFVTKNGSIWNRGARP
ncbi:DsbA family protein [Flavihumibacter petaseus]|uniref:DSBA-like thioredoxin domain-containing protein n=1 Tax=Flavihumibacter petaseus NBRC 106054 TaxID=1220578 RepID=A0A0E9N0G5_9BACT|nr:DsbA family protein [Flavihumibacter petaseus]GAO43121.1 hypothetical protein FPE01S_02_02250 [Flavihumibacter petaseus NBRC 106054]